MGLQRLGLPLLCVALLAGSFAAGFAFLHSPSRADPKEVIARPPESSDGGQAIGAGEGKAEQEARDQDPKEAPKKKTADAKPRKPLTRAEVANEGSFYVGERVTWVAEWKLTQSTLIAKKEGTQHVFDGQGPQGEFSFDFPFIAEEPTPVKQSPGRNVIQELVKRVMEERHKDSQAKRPKGRQDPKEHAKSIAIIVTVTGTINRLDTLIMLDRGTRHDVPVLTDITITTNR
jgi:hypothetical protein